jgi:thiosulfate/3-mercaptopyruvate sulfurtransferase
VACFDQQGSTAVRIRFTPLLTLLCVTIACAPAAGSTPERDVPRVDAREAAWLAHAPEVFVAASEVASAQQAGALLVDARSLARFADGHVVGAAHLPWERLVDAPASGRLSEDDAWLGQRLGDAGVRADAPLILYGDWAGDAPGSAWGEEGRAWWALRYLGHPNVRVVYGGVPALEASGVRFERGGVVAPPAPAPFVVQRQDDWRADADAVRAAMQQGTPLLDTRSPEEFAGQVLYGELRGGHVPGAASLWWEELFDAEGLRSPDEVRARLAALGVTGAPETRAIAYCTGGVRSGFVVLVASALGVPIANYDASMWEWAAMPLSPLSRP